MKKHLTTTTLLALMFHFVEAQELVRVASYNIKFLNKDISVDRKKNIEDVLEELDADVIGLQEIDDRAALENIFPPADWSIVIDDESGNKQDLAIVARKGFNIKGFSGNVLNADDEHFLFSDGSSSFFPNRRDLLAVEIEVPNTSESFFLMVAHTKARVGGRHTTDHRRVGAAREMIKKLEREFDDKKYILLGDFNDSPDDAIMNILESGNPNMPAAMENSEGAFMINLAEPMYAHDHVTFGRNNSDRLDDNRERISTIEPGVRAHNFANLMTDVNTGDCLFDQILIPVGMKPNYVSESFSIFDGASSVNGNSKTRASDHSPVVAEFVFGDDTESDGAVSSILITSALPNPNGDDTGNEYIRLKNVSDADIDLSGWSFKDLADNHHPIDGTIPPGTELKIMLTGDKMPLNNSGDSIFLFNAEGVSVAQVSYSASQVSSGSEVHFN